MGHRLCQLQLKIAHIEGEQAVSFTRSPWCSPSRPQRTGWSWPKASFRPCLTGDSTEARPLHAQMPDCVSARQAPTPNSKEALFLTKGVDMPPAKGYGQLRQRAALILAPNL